MKLHLTAHKKQQKEKKKAKCEKWEVKNERITTVQRIAGKFMAWAFFYFHFLMEFWEFKRWLIKFVIIV